MNEELKKALAEFGEELKKGLVTPEAMEEKLKSLTEQINKLPSSDDLKELRAALKEQGSALELLKKGKKNAEDKSLDEQIKAFIENAEVIEKAKANQKVSTDLKIKAASTIFASGNEEAIQALNAQVDRTIHSAPEEENSVFARLVKGTTSAPYIVWVNRVNKEGGAAWVEEGTLKPLMDWDYEPETSTAHKIAVSTKVSSEMLSDMPFMRAEIDKLLRQELLSKLNSELLEPGETDHSIVANASSYSGTSLDQTIVNPNYGDAIRAAILQMRLLNYRPDTLFVNPTAKAMIDLSKDSSGRYISTEIEALFKGIQIIETSILDAPQFVLADSSRCNVIPYEAIRLEYGFENDDFRKNLVTIICEMRLHVYLNSIDTGAVISDEFGVVQAALAKA